MPSTPSALSKLQYQHPAPTPLPAISSPCTTEHGTPVPATSQQAPTMAELLGDDFDPDSVFDEAQWEPYYCKTLQKVARPCTAFSPGTPQLLDSGTSQVTPGEQAGASPTQAHEQELHWQLSPSHTLKPPALSFLGGTGRTPTLPQENRAPSDGFVTPAIGQQQQQQQNHKPGSSSSGTAQSQYQPQDQHQSSWQQQLRPCEQTGAHAAWRPQQPAHSTGSPAVAGAPQQQQHQELQHQGPWAMHSSSQRYQGQASSSWEQRPDQQQQQHQVSAQQQPWWSAWDIPRLQLQQQQQQESNPAAGPPTSCSSSPATVAPGPPVVSSAAVHETLWDDQFWSSLKRWDVMQVLGDTRMPAAQRIAEATHKLGLENPQLMELALPKMTAFLGLVFPLRWVLGQHTLMVTSSYWSHMCVVGAPRFCSSRDE